MTTNEDRQEKDRAAQAVALKHMTEQWPHELALMKLICAIVKGRYDGYIEAGFPPEQALVLCLKKVEL